MRLLVTADLHYNHRHSRMLAEELIERINAAAAESNDPTPAGVLVVGDTAAADGDDLERCLSRFQIAGPKLFVAGNHELWTRGPDSHRLFEVELPERTRALGWHWLEGDPVLLPAGDETDDATNVEPGVDRPAGHVAVVGSIGWYDYQFALPHLGIPRRFYEHKVSPAAAERLEEFAHLLTETSDISEAGMQVAARWNDGRHVKLHRPDAQFLAERMSVLERDLERLERREDVQSIIVGIHHVPFERLLPPKPTAISSRYFSGGFLGSPLMGEVLARYSKVRRVYCGHSHLPAEATIGSIQATNIGSGYRSKTFVEFQTKKVVATALSPPST